MSASLQPAISFGYEFSAIGLRVWLSPDFSFGHVSPGLRTVHADHFRDEDWWTAAFSEVYRDDIRASSAFIVAENPSSRDTSDARDSVSEDKASRWLSALLLTDESQRLLPTIQLSGVHSSAGIEIHRASVPFQPSDTQHAPFRSIELRCNALDFGQLSNGDVSSAASLSRSLRFPPELRELEWRLRRALSIYFQARSEVMDFDKLYQFVRTLEAIVHVPRGRGAETFAHRATLFTGVEHETWLRKIYTTRSMIQHVNEDQILMPFDRSRMIEAVRMLIGAEWLARKVLTRVLATPALRRALGNAQSAEAFWALPQEEREGLWGAKLDVTATFGLYDLDRMTDQQLGKVD